MNQHTELEHTPKRNLYQQAFSAGIPFTIGDCRGIADWVCDIGVCCRIHGNGIFTDP